MKVNVTFTNSHAHNGINVAPGHFVVDKKTPGDHVEWNCNQSGFSVDFVGTSPFGSTHYDDMFTPGTINSGSILPTAQGGGCVYKYKVTIGGNVLDPTGQVNS